MNKLWLKKYASNAMERIQNYRSVLGWYAGFIAGNFLHEFEFEVLKYVISIAKIHFVTILFTDACSTYSHSICRFMGYRSQRKSFLYPDFRNNLRTTD